MSGTENDLPPTCGTQSGTENPTAPIELFHSHAIAEASACTMLKRPSPNHPAASPNFLGSLANLLPIQSSLSPIHAAASVAPALMESQCLVTTRTAMPKGPKITAAMFFQLSFSQPPKSANQPL